MNLDSDKEIVNYCNAFFGSVGENTASKIQNTQI